MGAVLDRFKWQGTLGWTRRTRRGFFFLSEFGLVRHGNSFLHLADNELKKIERNKMPREQGK